ncbi:hypothetical protein T440DRAFT_472286 [Plenodomus tracheiphilus IPT5]|uniref:Uncharacterized protein n=1 Tax=Plenodomus tracheiphilus IPT5 TaxID=1408161 RepID=A0A6A7ASD1_9PLEO|nr:hypothetical protein T440DRAFT_472286 [Plenodomus tracheiphilus IPT5]
MYSSHASQTEEHRSKRKFQPSITSYFALRDDFGNDQDLHHPHNRGATTQHPRESLAPTLPGQVQADLLNVGMRVRKAVPEGYKTQKLVSGLPTITTTLVNTPTTTLATYEVKPSRDIKHDALTHQRELLPFCGLNKVAGYAEQPTTNIHLYSGLDSHGQHIANMYPLSAEAFTQPFSSQGSADSGYSTSSQRLPNPLNPSKRSWHDDDEVRPLNTNFFFAIPKGNLSVEVDEVPVSPLSDTPPNMLPQARRFAQPKSRRQGQGTLSSSDEDIDMDFDNVTRVERRVTVGSSIDFEEADFLAHEVDMSGI